MFFQVLVVFSVSIYFSQYVSLTRLYGYLQLYESVIQILEYFRFGALHRTYVFKFHNAVNELPHLYFSARNIPSIFLHVIHHWLEQLWDCFASSCLQTKQVKLFWSWESSIEKLGCHENFTC